MHSFSIVDDGIVLKLCARLESWVADNDPRAGSLGAYNARVSEVTKALTHLLDALSSEADSRNESGKPRGGESNVKVSDAFRDLTYRLAEVYDFFGQLPEALNTERHEKKFVQDYRSAIKNARRTACLICNKLKHNNYVLSRSDNLYEIGIYVEGFVLMSRGPGAALNISHELHKDKKRPGISFNLGVRSLIFDFLRADVAAGRLCSALGAGEVERANIPLLNSLRLLVGRPEIGLRFDIAHTIRTMWEHSGEWVVGTKDRKLPSLGTKVHVIQEMGGDGYTKSFPLAG